MKKKYFSNFILLLLLLLTDSVGAAEQFPVVVEAEAKAMLTAQRSGVLSRLNVSAGDSVKKNQVLGIVFHEDLILKKQQIQARKQYLDIQVENLTKLNEKGIVTNEEVAKARMELAVNEKEISMIQSEIDRSKIRAPFSGLVVARHVQPHEWVTPGRDMVELYDPRKLRIMADIPSEIAMKLKPGDTDTIFFPDLKKDVKAVFKVLSPQVDVRSNTIKVYWTVPGGEMKKVLLLPGMKGVLKLGSD
jgi:RND family efflux transporter MFP subunit